MTARGIRLNNPTNLRKGISWQGLADVQSDPDFCTFKTPQFGIRAAARNLLNYQHQDDCGTIRQIIHRWAPPSENNTDAYVFAVSAGCKTDPDAPVSVDSVDVMLPLVKAIILHENGVNPYPDSLILEGIHAAGVSDASPPPLHQQAGFLTKAGAGIAASAAGAASYAPTVKGWADQLAGFEASPWIAHAKTALITVAGGLILLGILSDVLRHRSAA